METYNAIDVARFTINTHNKLTETGITNLRLQKLLYFIQADFLKRKRICFKEELKAWAYGSVVEVVYREFNKYDNGIIPNVVLCEHNQSIKVCDENIICDRDKKHITKIIEKSLKFPDDELVKIVCSQLPYREAFGRQRGATISKDSIKKYFQ